MNGDVFLYADDIAIVYSGNDPQLIQNKMNEDLSKLHSWMTNNKLTINSKKTHYILFKTNSTINITYDGQIIERVYQYKHLGVTYDSVLAWNHHIKNIKSKLTPLTGIFRKISSSVPHVLKRSLFFALFHPHILYGIQIWGNNFETNLKQLQITQNRAIKGLFNLPFRTSTTLAHAEHRILPIKDTYEIMAALHIWNILNGHILTNIEIPPTTVTTRGSSRGQIKNIKIYSTRFGTLAAVYGAIKSYNEMSGLIQKQNYTYNKQSLFNYRLNALQTD